MTLIAGYNARQRFNTNKSKGQAYQKKQQQTNKQTNREKKENKGEKKNRLILCCLAAVYIGK